MTTIAETSRRTTQALRVVMEPLTGDSTDFDRLPDAARHARLVLIGEASHGTHEFYRVRAKITKRLIREHGFIGVAAEADWPDAYRVNRYVGGRGTDRDAGEALGDFRRFPQWMWRNADVLDFVGWLREHNEHVRPAERVGFYGLDLYSLHASIEAVLRYLQRVDPKAAERAKQRYACFDRFGTDPQAYGYATRFDLTPTCEREVVSQLVELRRAAGEYATRNGLIAPDDLFFAQQNAGSFATPSATIAPCSAATSSRGTFATATCTRHSTRCGVFWKNSDEAPGSSSGRITLIWAMREKPKWAHMAS